MARSVPTGPSSSATAGASGGVRAATGGLPSRFSVRASLRPPSSRRTSMYLPIPSQPDCASAWREAVRFVDGQPGHAAYNVIIDIADPTTKTTRQDPRVAVVDDFLAVRQKSVETV